MTTALVASETLLLAVLTLFVVALLRSHAEILRRLETLAPSTRVPAPEAAPAGARRADDVTGATPSGGARHVSVAQGDLLLAFLSSGCASCARLVDTVPRGLASLPPSTRLVIVTKDPAVERRRTFRPLEATVPVVMSSVAWDAYEIPGSPYFVHVVNGDVAGEGSAAEWERVAHLLADAEAERADAAGLPRADAALAAAAIAPGHPSLRPRRNGADA